MKICKLTAGQTLRKALAKRSCLCYAIGGTETLLSGLLTPIWSSLFILQSARDSGPEEEHSYIFYSCWAPHYLLFHLFSTGWKFPNHYSHLYTLPSLCSFSLILLHNTQPASRWSLWNFESMKGIIDITERFPLQGITIFKGPSLYD